jgi:hypothetical protein
VSKPFIQYNSSNERERGYLGGILLIYESFSYVHRERKGGGGGAGGPGGWCGFLEILSSKGKSFNP